MGYEVKLLIGRECQTGDEYDYSTEPSRKTGHKETYFMTYAEIDLCKIGSGELSKAMESWKNKDKLHHWFYYGLDGNNHMKEDCYDDRWIPQIISEVLEPIKKDNEKERYGRFDWAIALLESMIGNEDIKVLIHAH